MPTFFCAFLLALTFFVQLPTAVNTAMNSLVAAPIIAEATSQPGSPLTTFSRLGKSIVRRLPVVRLLRTVWQAAGRASSGAGIGQAASNRLLPGGRPSPVFGQAEHSTLTLVSVLGAELGVQRQFGATRPRQWHRLTAPRQVWRARRLDAQSALTTRLEPKPAGRGYPQLTALWVRGAGWGVTVYWSGATGSPQRLRVEKRSRARQWTINWQRA